MKHWGIEAQLDHTQLAATRTMRQKSFIRSTTSWIDSIRGFLVKNFTDLHLICSHFFCPFFQSLNTVLCPRFEDYVEQESKRLDEFRPPDYGPKFEDCLILWALANKNCDLLHLKLGCMWGAQSKSRFESWQGVFFSWNWALLLPHKTSASTRLKNPRQTWWKCTSWRPVNCVERQLGSWTSVISWFVQLWIWFLDGQVIFLQCLPKANRIDADELAKLQDSDALSCNPIVPSIVSTMWVL